MTPTALRRALATLATCTAMGATPPAMKLWPGAAPGETGSFGPEHDATKPTDPLVGGRPLMHLTDVSVPTISVYSPPAGTANGTGVLVCPGGGYYILAWDLEGTEVCDWLNSKGVTAILLKYRVPRREGRAPHAAPLQDAQRAMGIARAHASEWGIDPQRLGVLGFSAGGHLAATLSASTERTYPRVDAADDQPFHPSFQLLIYPAYLGEEWDRYTSKPETRVTPSTPPTFMVMAEDDPIGPENILMYGIQLAQAKVPMEMHLFPTGQHGYGLRPTKDNVTKWPALAADWMASRGLLPAR
jgi:acetyl esterase/lipase